jgi:hypothetical protein
MNKMSEKCINKILKSEHLDVFLHLLYIFVQFVIFENKLGVMDALFFFFCFFLPSTLWF